MYYHLVTFALCSFIFVDTDQSQCNETTTSYVSYSFFLHSAISSFLSSCFLLFFTLTFLFDYLFTFSLFILALVLCQFRNEISLQRRECARVNALAFCRTTRWVLRIVRHLCVKISMYFFYIEASYFSVFQLQHFPYHYSVCNVIYVVYHNRVNFWQSRCTK